MDLFLMILGAAVFAWAMVYVALRFSCWAEGREW